MQVFQINTIAITPFTSHQVYEGLENGQTLLNNIKFNDIEGHWAKEPIQEVASLSLMNGTSYRQFRPNGTLTNAQALTTLVRAIGKESEAQILGQNQLALDVSKEDFAGIVEDWAKGYVQVAINEGILTADEITQITIWSNPVSRQQVAVWIARALEVPPSYGDKIVKAYSFTDWKQIDSVKLPLIETLLQKGWMQGMSPTMFSPRGTLSRGQMAQLIVNVNDELLAKRGITKKTGIIYDLETVQMQGINNNIFTIENDDNSKNIISVTPSQNKDFILQKDGVLTLSTPLRVGNRLAYYINNKNEVVYSKIVPNNREVIEGFIDYIDTENNRLIVVDFDDKRHLLQGEVFTTVKVNGEDATFKDLFNGQEVNVSLVGKQIKEIAGFLDIDPTQHGYIRPGSRTKVGKVVSISQNAVEINTEGKIEKYKITTNTEVLRGGGRANLFEIKEGDRVLLTFDDIYTVEIASIQVENSEKHITALYRGTLEYINVKLGEVLLNNISVYENGKWNSHSDQKIKLKV